MKEGKGKCVYEGCLRKERENVSMKADEGRKGKMYLHMKADEGRKGKMQGWALRSFQFGTLRSFPF